MSAEPLQYSDSMATPDMPFTEEDYFALPENNRRIDLIDGNLLVSPLADLEHQRLISRLCGQLDERPPDGTEVLPGANVRLQPDRIIIPDFLVFREVPNALVLDASDVLLVGEVVSPSSRSVDRVFKPTLCAEAGIEWYLRVERDPRLELILCRRRDHSSYAVHTKAGKGERLELPEFGCGIDVDALLRPRG